MGQILFETASALNGAPDIPLPKDISLDSLKEIDPNPMFITLPIGKVGVTSGNNRTYPRKAIESLVNSVNTNRPGGIKGHLRDDERAYKFELPSVLWLAAEIDSNGLAWGKAMVVDPDTKQYFNVAKATGAKVATSIYGTAEMNGNEVTNLEIESIDLAHPKRAGVPEAVAKAVVTSEMADKTLAEIEAFKRKTLAEQATAFVSASISANGDDMLEVLQGLMAQIAALQQNLPANPAVEETLQKLNVNRTLRPLVREFVAYRADPAALFANDWAGLQVNKALDMPGMRQTNDRLNKITDDYAHNVAGQFGLLDSQYDRPMRLPVQLDVAKSEPYSAKARTAEQEREKTKEHEELAANANEIAQRWGVTGGKRY
jgi:hypothetical protein